MRYLQFSLGECATEGGCGSQWHYFLQECSAGDIDIIGLTMRDVTAVFRVIKQESAKMGLAVNEGKTKYMLTTSKVVPRMGLHITAKS